MEDPTRFKMLFFKKFSKFLKKLPMIHTTRRVATTQSKYRAKKIKASYFEYIHKR